MQDKLVQRAGPDILPCIQHIFCCSRNVAVWLQYRSYKCTRTGKYSDKYLFCFFFNSEDNSRRVFCDLIFLKTINIFQVIEKFIRKAHRQRNFGKNMTYEASTFMYAMAVSIFAIGGMCGGFIGGWIANRFGRKGGLLINNIVGIIAATAMVFSKFVTSYELLIIGRFLIGVNCGEFPPWTPLTILNG